MFCFCQKNFVTDSFFLLRDALQDRTKESITAARERERAQRQALGYSEWADQRNKERMEKAKKLGKFLPQDLFKLTIF